MKVLNYEEALPLPWVYIETWNDWNEGTEIEASAEHRYQYLLSTIDNIALFKGTTISMDTLKFIDAESLYIACRHFELEVGDYPLSDPEIREDITNYLNDLPGKKVLKIDAEEIS